jgi:hypothetical protein
MAVLVPCRGSVYRVNPMQGQGGERGFYEVDGLTAKKGDGDALLINTASPNENDVVLPVITLENTRILYSFGANFGDMTISGLILLGKSGNPGTSLATVIDFFKQKRVSSNKEAVKVTGPGTSWKVFLTGLTISDADPQINSQTFAFTGKIAAPK